MTLLSFRKSSYEAPNNRRSVSVRKIPNSRIGIGLTDCRGRGVVIAEVHSSSPLEGLVWPGEVIRSVHGMQLKMDAQNLSNALRAAQSLEIVVETPSALADARSVFLISNGDVETGRRGSGCGGMGLVLERDQSSGFARIASITAGSIAEATISRDSLAVGDLLVSVGGCGVLHETETAQEALAKLQSLSGEIGAVELRLVRPSGWAGADPIREPSRDDEICSPGRRHSYEAAWSPPPYENAHVTTLTSMLEHARFVSDGITSVRGHA